MKRNLIAHCCEGSSDKVYMACIRDNGDGTFSVIGKWGRRGKAFSNQLKLTTKDIRIAQLEQQALFDAKLSKGYIDIDGSAYHGPVTRGSSDIQNDMESEPDEKSQKSATPRRPTQEDVDAGQVAKKAAKKAAKEADGSAGSDDETVVCVSNVGMENRFDEGIEYLFEPHSDSAMIYVYDKFGKKDEFLKERFVMASKYKGDMKFYQPKPGDKVRVFRK